LTLYFNILRLKETKINLTNNKTSESKKAKANKKEPNEKQEKAK
jgi:hypothetical protein